MQHKFLTTFFLAASLVASNVFAEESPLAVLIGLSFFGGVVLLFGQALKDRMSNKEDDYYNKNVKQ